MNLKIAAQGLLFVLALCSTAVAGPITTYATSAGFGGNDTIDWGALGDDGTTLGPSASMPIAGLTVASDLDMRRYDEGASWNGHFASGEHLLHSGNGSSALHFTFDSAVSGLGLRTHSNAWGDFAATLEVFGAGGLSLGAFSVNGFGGLCHSCDNAPFLGIKSALPEIVSAILTSTNDGSGFAIGSLVLDRGPASQVLGQGPVFEILDRAPDRPAVPEPSALALGALGLAVAVYRRQRRG